MPVVAFISAVPRFLAEVAAAPITTHSGYAPIEIWHVTGISNGMGLLTLAPPIWLWARHPHPGLEWRQLAELGVYGAIAALIFAKRLRQWDGEGHSYGVFNIHQRIELLGGAFEASADRGCRITLYVPGPAA